MIYTVTLNPALDRELTVPALAFDEVLRATGSRTDYGGKGLNVSRMLAALGAKSVALGFAGGHTGDILREGMEVLGIPTDFTPIAGETRTNISIVTSDHDRHIKVNEPGPIISDQERQAFRAQVRQLARPGDWWVLAGSLPLGVPPEYYAELVQDIQAAGGYSVVDTSGAGLRAACAAKPFVIKPNAQEVSELTGMAIRTAGDAVVAARMFEGISYVVISLGHVGAVLYHQGRAWAATPPLIEARNPIGAGDSMVAGFVWGLHVGDAEAALRLGVACGAATASCSGTAVGTGEQVTQLAEQVRIQLLSSG